MVPTVALVTLPKPCAALRIAASGSSPSPAFFAAVRDDRVKQRAQILHVDQGKTVVVGNAEGNVQHAFLHIVQIEHPRQQQRAHFSDGGAHRVTLFAEHVPKYRRKPVGLEREADVAGALDDKILGLAGFGDARKVSLDVGSENRDAGARKSFSHHLQRHRFSGSGGAGDEAMAISERERQPDRLFALADENFPVGIGHLVVGRRHGIASSHASRVSAPAPRSYCMLQAE